MMLCTKSSQQHSMDLFECRTISFSLGPVCFQKKNSLLETIFPTFQYLVTLRKIGQGENIF